MSVGCLLEAVALLRRDTCGVWVAVAGTCGAAVAAYVWSRAVGLPEIADDVGRWTEPLGLVSIVAEAVAVGCALIALVRPNLSSGLHRGPAIAGMLVLVGGLGGTAAATATPSEHASMAITGNSYWDAVGGGAFHSDGTTRTYYISADQVVWDYAPDGRNDITGRAFDQTADTYVRSGPGRIGSKYLKCLYRGYTDRSFTRLLPKPTDQRYLGLLGSTRKWVTRSG